MKSTMSNRNIAKYHRLLKGGLNLEEVSEALKIDVDTLKRFTPKIMAKVKKAKKRAADKAYGKEVSEPESEPTAPATKVAETAKTAATPAAKAAPVKG